MNLLETIMGQLGSGTLDKISGALGESTDGTKSAIGAAIPALLGQVANKAGSEEGAGELFDMLGDDDGSSLDNFSDMLSEDNREGLMEQGSGMLSGLMGNGAGGFTSMLSGFTGMGGNKMTSLLGMVAPLIMGSLGKAKSSMGLNASGLANMLSEQSSQFTDALPAGLGDKLGSLGLGASMSGAGGNVVSGTKEVVSNVGSKTTEVVGGAVNKTGEVVSGAAGAVGDGAKAVGGAIVGGAAAGAAAGGGLLKKLLPILGILGLLLLGLFLWKSCGSDAVDATKNAANKTVNATKNVAGNAVDATKNAAGNAVDATKNAAGNAANATKNAAGNAVDATKNAAGNATNAVKNAAGKTAALLGFDKSSKEAEFANSLSNGKARVGSNFILDKVTFASGSANLASSSYAQLNNIQKVMASYPGLKVKLVGHTDNTGNADSNVKLSKARAAAVLTYLTGKGINKARLTSDGIGGAKPIASNSSADGKRQNRRVEAVISSLK